MHLGRVIGCVWSTIKDPALTSQRFLVVQPVHPDGSPHGKQLLCTDSTGAGAGEFIYWCRGREATYPFLPEEVPTDATIVGVVDEIHVPKKPAAGS